jgi:hypothetical protein
MEDADITRFFDRVTSTHGQRGAFNPSIAYVDDATVFAYRALRKGENVIRAFLVISSGRNGSEKVLDLTEIGARFGVHRVADPKLVKLGDNLYVTFNTGFQAKGQNDIYLMSVYPVVGEPQRVIADFERQKVEKNWAFAQSQQDSLFAIYSLHPYAEVFLVKGEIGEGGDLHFARRVPQYADSSRAAGLSIGTQMLPSSRPNGGHLLVAHEKWVVPRRSKRMYFGRAVTVNGLGTEDVHVLRAPDRLIHHWKDALPRPRGVHNHNLLSATYFSGLARSGEDLKLGYGVNDRGLAVATVKESDIWV